MDLLNLKSWQRSWLGFMLALGRYPVVCAWCMGELEPKATVVGWAKVEHSHGMCRYHLVEWNVVTNTH